MYIILLVCSFIAKFYLLLTIFGCVLALSLSLFAVYLNISVHLLFYVSNTDRPKMTERKI